MAAGRFNCKTASLDDVLHHSDCVLIATPPDSHYQLIKLSLENDDYELFRLKTDKQPIGVYWDEKDFTTQWIKLQVGDSLYMFTDGIADQFGGKNRKKYKSRRLKKLLLSYVLHQN